MCIRDILQMGSAAASASVWGGSILSSPPKSPARMDGFFCFAGTKNRRTVPPTAAGSLAEQIAVRPGAGQRQHKYIVLDAVDEQPVRLDVAFPMAHPIAGQLMVFMLLRQFSPRDKARITSSRRSMFMCRLSASL